MPEDYDQMRADLNRLTVKQLREVARAEGICLGYDGARKDTAIAAIVGNREYRERTGERGE